MRKKNKEIRRTETRGKEEKRDEGSLVGFGSIILVSFSIQFVFFRSKRSLQIYVEQNLE